MTVLGYPDKDSYLLVELRYGKVDDPTFARYTDWNQNVVGPDAEEYTATPAMEVKVAPISGTLRERPSSVTLPLDDLTERISNGFVFSPIFIKVTEAIVRGLEVEYLVHFIGRAVSYTRNDDGRRNRVKLNCENWKSLLSMPAGIPATHQCIWGAVGDHNCKADIEPHIAPGLVASIENTLATITGLPPHNDDPTERFWHNGFVEFEGATIRIRDWHNSSPNIFQLQQRMPSEWEGEFVTVTPGCDYRIGTCDGRWNNVERFMGFGIGIPSFNPLFEISTKES